MKIAILSDSHDNIVNLTKALKFINKEKIKTLIHCGDLCAPSILTEVMVPNFKGKMHLVHGNVGDPELLEKVAKGYKDITIHGYKGEMTISGHPEFISGSQSEKILKQVQDDKSKGIPRPIRLRSGQALARNDNIKIAFTHFPQDGKKLAQSGKYDLVFYGHTHRPWVQGTQTHAEKGQRQSASSRPARHASQGVAGGRKSALMVNPGTVGGMFYKATFAIYDTKTNKLELKILERL